MNELWSSRSFGRRPPHAPPARRRPNDLDDQRVSVDVLVDIVDGVAADLYDRTSLPGSYWPERITRPHDHDEWLTVRRGYYNASAAGALYGDHPYLSLARIVRDKLTPSTVDFDNPAMRRGRHLEPAVANWWADEHDTILYEPDELYAAGPLLATLDRRIVDDPTTAVEIKTTAHTVDEPERYWWWQAHAQLTCCPDLERVHVAVLDATMRLQTFTITRDPDVSVDLLARADAVMRYVNVGKWPPAVAGEHLQLPNPIRQPRGTQP